MRVAFASKDGITINEHFGWCKQFYLYDITPSGFTFIKNLDASLEISDEVNKLTYKIACLEDTQIVCVAQIGPKASQMLKANGIFAMQSSRENEEITNVIHQIIDLAKNNPPLWMQRVLSNN